MVETGVEREKTATLVKTFPNLMREDGLLPLPKEVAKVGAGIQQEGWKSGVDLANPSVVDRGIRGGTSPFLPRLEGSVVIHPCCRTTCSVLSAPVGNKNWVTHFGGKKQ